LPTNQKKEKRQIETLLGQEGLEPSCGAIGGGIQGRKLKWGRAKLRSNRLGFFIKIEKDQLTRKMEEKG